MYRLIVRQRAEKNFAKIPRKLQERILKAFKKLETDPFQTGLDVKKLVGTNKSYRMRVGELRIIYEMDTRSKEIFVTDIDFRRTTSY